jgi:hypothetical protein
LARGKVGDVDEYSLGTFATQETQDNLSAAIDLLKVLATQNRQSTMGNSTTA